MLQRRRHFGACCETELRNALCDSCRNRFEMLRSLCCFTGKALNGCSLTCVVLMLSQRRVSQPSAASMRSMRWNILTCNDKLHLQSKVIEPWPKFQGKHKCFEGDLRPREKVKILTEDLFWGEIGHMRWCQLHHLATHFVTDQKTGLWLVCGWTYKNIWLYML